APGQALADRAAAVLDAVGDDRPAVVAPGAHDVQLVAAAGAVLHGPQLARSRVQGRALDVAVAQRPDLGPRARLADEGIVRRDRAVGVDAHDLAQVAAGILGLGPGLQIGPLAQGDVEPPGPVEHQTRA